MDEYRKDLVGKTILSDQVATELCLTDAENVSLEAGMVVYENNLEKLKNKNGGVLPDGAEDEAVAQAEQTVTGFSNALTKWANGFRATFISGRDS